MIFVDGPIPAGDIAVGVLAIIDLAFILSAASNHAASNEAKTASEAAAASMSPPAPGMGDDNDPEYKSNPKHHKNSSSPEPSNAKELFKKSISDKKGVRWAKDDNGVIHRFSKPSNGQSHWNGSTAGKKPIRMEDIPSEIRKLLK